MSSNVWLLTRSRPSNSTLPRARCKGASHGSAGVSSSAIASLNRPIIDICALSLPTSLAALRGSTPPLRVLFRWIPDRARRHTHKRAGRETPYQGLVLLKVPQPFFRRDRHYAAGELVEWRMFANVVVPRGQRSSVEANERSNAPRPSETIAVVLDG